MTNSLVGPLALKVGDLVFLYLAQDGKFNTTSVTSDDYGSLLPGTTTNAGKWQINRVYQRAGSVVRMECDLDPSFLGVTANANNYHTMVLTKFITAKQLTLTINAQITPVDFTSQLVSIFNFNFGGGVVPILARTISMASGSSIDASGKGFTGGTAMPIFPSPCTYCTDPCAEDSYLCTSPGQGGQKGASIAPFSEDSNVRNYCRGALANGGGGGNNHNAPGGGGANVCASANSIPWTGNGVTYPIIIIIHHHSSSFIIIIIIIINQLLSILSIPIMDSNRQITNECLFSHQ